MDDREKLIEQANIYKAGDSGVDHDEASFWLWRGQNREIDFILELSDKKLTCVDTDEIWYMSPTLAKECRVIDITEGYCPECKFSDRCTKRDEVDEINSESKKDV